MMKRALIAIFVLVSCTVFAGGSTTYPWPTNWSLGGLASWSQPLMASGTLPATSTANTGEFFLDISAPSTPALYRHSGSAWVLVAGGAGSDPGLATCGKDLSGTVGTATVIGIQGRAASSTAPTDAQVMTWDNANSVWKPATPAVATTTVGGDLSGNLPNPTVAKIQGTAASSTAPVAKQIMRYTATGWAPSDFVSSGTETPATSSYTVGDLYIVGTMPPIIYRLNETATSATSAADLIPTMTSNTAPSGTATRSAAVVSSVEAWKTMDKENTSYWQPAASPGYPQYVGYGFAASQTITQYEMMCPNTASAPHPPGSWTFEACDPGGEWVVLATETQDTWVYGATQTFMLTNDTPYTYYRVNVATNAGTLGTLAIHSLTMFGTEQTTSSEWQEIGLYRSSATPTGTIITGAHWYDTNENKERVYDGSDWQFLW